MDNSAASSVPIKVIPISFSSFILRAKFVTGIKGTTSAAPLATLVTVAFTCAERSLGTTTPCTPAPSATRKQAPKLWGSVTPSKTNSKAGPSIPSTNSGNVLATVILSASATRPWCRSCPAKLCKRSEFAECKRSPNNGVACFKKSPIRRSRRAGS